MLQATRSTALKRRRGMKPFYRAETLFHIQQRVSMFCKHGNNRILTQVYQVANATGAEPLAFMGPSLSLSSTESKATLSAIIAFATTSPRNLSLSLSTLSCGIGLRFGAAPPGLQAPLISPLAPFADGRSGVPSDSSILLVELAAVAPTVGLEWFASAQPIV
jgi:hypothetical protein